MGRKHGARQVESVDLYSYEGGGVMKDLLEKWSLAVFSLSERYLSARDVEDQCKKGLGE